MRTIGVNIKQAVLGKTFIISLLVFVIIIVLSQVSQFIKVWEALQQVWQEQGEWSQVVVLPNGIHSTLFLMVLESEGFFLISPILCTLPFASIVIDEIRSGTIKSYLPRTSRNKYIIGKLIANFIAGGALLVVGLMIVYMIFLILIAPFEKASIPVHYYYFNFVEKIPVLFCFGGLNALMGLTFGTITHNKYMCYASPFVVVYMLMLLHDRYIPDCYVISVREWIMPKQKWIFGNNGIVLFQVVVILTCALCFGIYAKRRLKTL